MKLSFEKTKQNSICTPTSEQMETSEVHFERGLTERAGQLPNLTAITKGIAQILTINGIINSLRPKSKSLSDYCIITNIIPWMKEFAGKKKNLHYICSVL